MVRFFVLVTKIILILSLTATGFPVYAEGGALDQAAVRVEIRNLLSTPEADLDLAKAKLTMDRIIDPSINIPVILKQIDGMTAQAKTLVPQNADKKETLHALQVYLYVAGPWNNHQPFKYDLDDPLGRNVHNKLLSTYIAKRKGNCVSMPILFVILGQKIGLDVTLANAPLHIFVKFRDEQGQITNVEATTGGFKKDDSYQADFPMTKQALSSGIYMQPLTKRESVAAMTETVQQFYGQKGWPQRRIALADAVLKTHPKNISAILNKASAYSSLIRLHFIDKYPTPDQIPMERWADYEALGRNSQLWFNKAEELGGRQESKADDEKYLNRIKKVTVEQKQGK
jgi:regulator of sirC expression with transglutaminase-like and TPR domain